MRLSDEGFCFRRFLGVETSEYYRPGRAGYNGNRSCVTDGSDPHADAWARQSARWHSGPCHRSLYGYQMRAALGLAIENPRIAVTFIPLACSGATIAAGFLGSQRITECPSPGTNTSCSSTSRAQLAGLTEALAIARKHRADRALDLVLLTIGANDIQFAGLVADVIIESRTERLLFGRSGHIATVPESRRILDGNLPNDFLKLRAALKPLVGGDLARVVFVSYGHPALAAPDTPCPGGRSGFDVHPAFGADPQRLRNVVQFVSNEFLPKIRAIATCDGKLCRDPRTERMTFVDAHQAAFAQHGVCARAEQDPEFDRACFAGDGDTFQQRSGARSQRSARLRPSQRVPCLCAAGALGAHRERQLLHRHDLSAGYFERRRPRPASTMRSGACCPPSTAAPSIRPRKATRRWPTRRCRRCATCSASAVRSRSCATETLPPPAQLNR